MDDAIPPEDVPVVTPLRPLSSPTSRLRLRHAARATWSSSSYDADVSSRATTASPALSAFSSTGPDHEALHAGDEIDETSSDYDSADRDSLLYFGSQSESSSRRFVKTPMTSDLGSMPNQSPAPSMLSLHSSGSWSGFLSFSGGARPRIDWLTLLANASLDGARSGCLSRKPFVIGEAESG